MGRQIGFGNERGVILELLFFNMSLKKVMELRIVLSMDQGLIRRTAKNQSGGSTSHPNLYKPKER